MEYTIVSGVMKEVVKNVNAFLKDGWELHGSLTVSATANFPNEQYAQAMIRRTRTDHPDEEQGSTGFRSY